MGRRYDDKIVYKNIKKTQTKRKEARSPTKQSTHITEDKEEKYDDGYDSDCFKGPFWGATRKEGDKLSEIQTTNRRSHEWK